MRDCLAEGKQLRCNILEFDELRRSSNLAHWIQKASDCMHDAAARWSLPPVWDQSRIDYPGIFIHSLAGLQLVMISGQLESALNALDGRVELKGPYDVRAPENYAIRVGPD